MYYVEHVIIVCPENIIKIEDRKPQIKGKCPEDVTFVM